MPIWLSVTVTVFGAAFFLGHVLGMCYSLRFANTRDDRLEFIGGAVPGLAGLLIGAIPWTTNALAAILLCSTAMVTMILGRAGYEMFAFRHRR